MHQVLLVPIQIKPSYKESFIKGIVKHAKNCLDIETGCIEFDIVQDNGDENRIWLYEVYDSEKALEIHTNSYHLNQWHSQSKEWRDDRPLAPVNGFKIWSAEEISD